MSKLQTLPCRVQTIKGRVATAEPNRQVRRQYATNSREWLLIRRRVLLRDHYTCKHCSRVAGGKGEAHVDHVDGDSTNNPQDGSNWQTLCAPCHSRKTSAENGGFGNVRQA